MARIRTIKPSFWKNEDLAALPFEARLLFIGLWNYADSEGRLEDRPKRLKVDILPYDDVNIDELLILLHDGKFIFRYAASNGIKLIQVINFTKHQRITGSEANQSSEIEPPKKETLWKHQGNTKENDIFSTIETTPESEQIVDTKTLGEEISSISQIIDNHDKKDEETPRKHQGSTKDDRKGNGVYNTPLLDNKDLGTKGKEDIQAKNNTSTEKSRKNKKSVFATVDEKAEYAWVVVDCPFSDKFKHKWIQLCNQPKWGKKNETSFILALQKLMNYEEEFSISLIDSAIMGGWQGVVFPETNHSYEKWKENKSKKHGRQATTNSNNGNGLNGASSQSAFEKIKHIYRGTGD